MPFPSQVDLRTNNGPKLLELYKVYPTPSAQLLHSSYALPTDLVPFYKRIVANIQIELSQAHADMAHFPDLLAPVHQRLHRSSIHYKSLVAPIRRLPAEVLSEIFMALPRDPDAEPFALSNCPVLLTRVCSFWRNVAISTPRLWDLVVFTVNEQAHVKPFTLAFWQIWLSRSRASPLTIRVDFESDELPPRFPYGPIVDLLVSCSCRWSKLRISVPFTLEHFAAVQGCIPMLQQLVISLPNYSTPLDPLAIFEVAPRLRELVLWSPVGVNPQSRWPWVQLQTFTGTEMSVDDCLTILAQCPDLLYCCLLWVENIHAINIPVPRPILPNLQTLCVSIDDEVLCKTLFDSLTCPGLKSLHIQPVIEILPLSLSYLPSFIKRSSCNLQELVLGSISLRDPDLVTCLEGLPLLADLSLTEVDNPLFRMEPHLFDRMGCDGVSMLLPKLEMLTLGLDSAPAGYLLARMINSRCDMVERINALAATQNPIRLESIRITFRRKADCERFAGADIWRNDGPDIELFFFEDEPQL